MHLFAGLCAVDTRAHVDAMMAALARAGIVTTRMGAYKPRTSPYDFQGLGRECLPWVFELAGKHGIRIVAMEATDAAHIDEIRAALESAGSPTGVMLQVGTRNAQNYELLKQIGRQQEFPVLFKRGMGITLEESLNACEYVASEGNPRIVFCLRGVKTHLGDPHRNLVDFAHVPVVRRQTRLPVCIDPSHSVGKLLLAPDGVPDIVHAIGQGIGAGAAFPAPGPRTAGAEARAEPRTTAEVRSPLRGRIAEILVAEGDRVPAGAPLLRIEAPVEAALATMERETATRLRREALRLHGAGDASRAATLEDQAEAARLKAEDMEGRIAEASVPSPLAGTVLTHRVGELAGSPVARNSTILKVGDLSRVRFRPLLDARDAGAVREGMEAEIRFRESPGTPLRGKVVAVSNAPLDAARDERAKGLAGPHWEIVVEAENTDGRVLPGMSGDVRVLLGRTSLAGALLRGVGDAFRPDVLR